MTGTLLVQGLGAHTVKTVLPAIETATGWRLAGLISRRSDVATEMATELGVEHHADLTAALDGDLPDAVYVATEPSDHLASCRTALEAGVKTVFCEKPLATTAEHARQLVDLAEAHGITAAPLRAFRA